MPASSTTDWNWSENDSRRMPGGAHRFRCPAPEIEDRRHMEGELKEAEHGGHQQYLDRHVCHNRTPRRLPPEFPKQSKAIAPGSARTHKPYRQGQAGSRVRSISLVDFSGARPRRMDGSRIGARRYRKSDNTDAGHERHHNDPQVSCAVGAVNRGVHASLLFETGKQVSRLTSNQS